MYESKFLSEIKYFSNLKYDNWFDSLTEVLNRRTIDGLLKYLIENKTKFSMYLFDVDNFKNINDLYGHATGDIVMKEIAQHLVKLVGDKGLVGRYGGDEFIIVSFYAFSYEEMMDFMRHVHGVLANNRYFLKRLPNIPITLTAGGVSYPKDADTYEALFGLMDKAMYRGKQKGRNCFIVYVKEMHQNIDASLSLRISSTDLIIDEIYQILLKDADIDSRIERLKELFNSVLFIPDVKFIDNVTIETLFTNDEEKFVSKEYDLFKNTINQRGAFVVQHIKDVPSLKTFARNCKAVMESCVIYNVEAYGIQFGYFALIDPKRRHIWQNDDKILAACTAKMLGLIMYQNKK